MVRFENVGLRYGLGPEILRDLSLVIPAHSFQFLTGPSGAGKTSLLKLLFLSLRPTRGLVNLFGQDVSLLNKDHVANLRKRIGIVLQDFRLLDHMTTYENVALPFRVMGRNESSYRKEVIDLLKWVGLGERMDALPPILSGGEKQRAAGNGGARHNGRHIACARRQLRTLVAEVHQRSVLLRPTHRCASVPDAAPAAAPHTDPSA